MHIRATIAAIEPDEQGRIRAVIDSDGERLETDLLVRAIGVEPAIGWLEGSEVATGRGVVVDERLANAAPDVYAAGDCAEVRRPGEERGVIDKLWYTARPMGWVAGENMAGGNAIYEELPQFQTAMFMDLDFASCGEMPDERNGLQEHNLTAPNAYDSVMLVHDGERVRGCSFLGRALTKEDIEHLVEERMPLADAITACARVLDGQMYDRAPLSRIAERERLSRRPGLWPFGDQRVQRGLWKLTGGF